MKPLNSPLPSILATANSREQELKIEVIGKINELLKRLTQKHKL